MDKSKLDKAIEHFEEAIKFFHSSTGGNVLLEEVKADVYNSKMKIRDLGTVNSLGSGSYVVNLWDSTIAETVKNAILDTLNLNPSVDGGSLKVNFPAPTQEKRTELSKVVSTKAEDCLVSIRNLRRDEMTIIDKQFKAKEISEDVKASLESKVDELIKIFNKKVDEIKTKKITEINTL